MTANDKVNPYSGPFMFGTNQGYYKGWSSKDTASLMASIGSKTIRIPLYDDFLSTYGITNLISDLDFVVSKGMKELTAFVGSPSAANRDSVTLFKGLYADTWIDAAKTQINTTNTFANYLYNVVKTYGKYITFWEIVNEPDFTYSAGGWLGDYDPPQPGSWFDHNPLPSELVNISCTIFNYNRMLRVSWEVIKTLQPDQYVCTGGIGNRSFLDAILRNTDNPLDGSISANYPLKGGAYFDCVSFHNYPEFQLKYWDAVKGVVAYTRHSDAALNIGILRVLNWMKSGLAKYGYDGVTYPKKVFICSETNVSREPMQDRLGGVEQSKNYIMKITLAAQANGIGQLYIYQLGDGANTATNEFDEMGLFTDLLTKLPTDTPTISVQGIAYQTCALLLAGYSYDPIGTAALKLPSNVGGYAFKDASGNIIYGLWAKTTTDLSESASAVYTFPVPINNLQVYNWDYSKTKAVISPASVGGLTLNATPVLIKVPVVPAGPKTVLDVAITANDGSVKHYVLKDDHTWS